MQAITEWYLSRIEQPINLTLTMACMSSWDTCIYCNGARDFTLFTLCLSIEFYQLCLSILISTVFSSRVWQASGRWEELQHEASWSIRCGNSPTWKRIPSLGTWAGHRDHTPRGGAWLCRRHEQGDWAMAYYIIRFLPLLCDLEKWNSPKLVSLFVEND